MGQAKQKRLAGFSENNIRAMEEGDCVNFAIALSRKTGWLLHVDWMTNHRTEGDLIPEKEMIPLRVYVGDDKDTVFDVRGMKKIHEFNRTTIQRIAKSRIPKGWNTIGVATRTYSEEELWELPLRVTPDENCIGAALKTIEDTRPYIESVPIRPAPVLPANLAYEFAFGKCVVYAAAYEDITGSQAVALCIDELLPGWEGTDVKDNGFVHSFIVHESGIAEDSWGRQPVEKIAKRFGGKSWHFSRDVHLDAVKTMKRNTPDRWAKKYEEAAALIHMYALPVEG